MKKSKVLVPALAVLAFSTAASITGTVAWFTANRVATVTAGEFAVVNTSSDLSVTLGTGVGTAVSDVPEGTHTVTTTSGYKLTDGSFDHTIVAENVITPDVTGTKIGKVTTILNNATLADDMERDSTNHVYTAFTWDMTFTVAFGGSASKSLGLFLDLSSNETYMHEKVHLAKDTVIPASTYYSDAACTTAVSAGTVSENEGVDYYKTAPDETGKAFRIAFVPTAIAGTGTGTSYGYAKVWAKNEDAGHCGFTATAAVDTALSRTAYSTATTQLSGNASSSAFATATAGSDMVLMDSSASTGIPADSAVTASAALSGKENFLGVFALDAGKNVSITFTCVAWFDGTDTAEGYGHIVNAATDFETIVTSMKFGVADLANA